MDNRDVVEKLRVFWNRSFAARAAAGFAAAAASLAVIGLAATAGYLHGLDQSVREGVSYTAAPGLTEAMRSVTRLGSTIVLTVVGSAAVLVFAFLKWWRAAGLFLLAMAGQIVLHHGFKALIARERPGGLLGYQVSDSYSFPSGHALASLSEYGMLAWIVANRTARPRLNAVIWTFVSILVFVIGYSRIYFGVHNATDVMAGYLAALIWIWACASGDTTDGPRGRG